jgi:hypothetical protein
MEYSISLSGTTMSSEFAIKEPLSVYSERFNGAPIFIPNKTDFRGRLYPRSGKLNTHSSKYSRSMLQFWNPKPLNEIGWSFLSDYIFSLVKNHLPSGSIDRAIIINSMNTGKIDPKIIDAYVKNGKETDLPMLIAPITAYSFALKNNNACAIPIF